MDNDNFSQQADIPWRCYTCISHLSYADDLIIFSKTSLVEAVNMKRIVDLCSVRHLGKRSMWGKSSVFFNSNVHHRHQKMLTKIWEIKKFDERKKYLGVPLLLTWKKNENFDYLVESLQKEGDWVEGQNPISSS